MIGHKQIITARQQGFKPVAVFIEAGLAQMPVRFAFEDPEQALAHNLPATVIIGLGEIGERHDLRFLVDCRVHLHGMKLTDELLELADRIVAAGALHVIVCGLEDSEILVHKNGEWHTCKSLQTTA